MMPSATSILASESAITFSYQYGSPQPYILNTNLLSITGECIASSTKLNDMEKQKQSMRAVIATLFCCIFWNTACVNPLNDELQEGSVPISFTTKIGKASTKVSNTAFDKGDEVGLFATLTSSGIEHNPYINNLRLVCGGGSLLTPEKMVFYPEGDFSLDFISYYPYRSEGKTEDSALLPVAVEKDQSDTLKHSQSDFLIARKNKVQSSSKAVELEYDHKLVKIKITLTPGQDERVEDMLKANPRITATGFKTQATYNLKEDVFSELSHPADIITFGKWSIQEERLTGKEFIILPQSVSESEQAFVMEWNGKLYDCSFPTMELESGTEYVINISSIQANDPIFQGIISKINDWKPGAAENTDNQKKYTAVHLAALSFTKSNVYRVYNSGKPVAEICKEYLRSEELTSRAIVAYPVQENEDTDLSNGIVLHLLDKEEAINGGKISWDLNTNSFSYQPGSSAPISQFYINAQKEIVLEEPENAINVNVTSHRLRDLRDGTLEEYPMVKIGIQYWMRTELHATAYQTGKKLSQQTELGEGAGYFKPEGYDIYFYNGEALLNGKLNPIGWRIPSEEDWNHLKEYNQGSTASLKAGEWQVLSEGEVSPVNNLTMFSAYPVGVWFNGAHSNVYTLTGFWTWDELNQTIPEQTVYFVGEEDDFVLSHTMVTGKNYYKALSIRCIKE